MPAGDYFVGLVYLLLTYGAVATATEIAVRRRLPLLHGATRLIAWAVLATAALLASCLVPAVLGILSRESMAAAALAIAGLVAWLLPATTEGPPGDRPPAPAASRAERLLGIAGVVGAGLWVGYTLIRYRTHEPVGFDAAAAYLPTAARWLQEGSIWQLADWVPNAFYGSGPGNGSVLVLSTMLPWDNDFLSHLAMYPYVVLFAFVLYALARELGAPWPAAALLGTMVAAAPVVVQHGFSEGLLDPVMYSTLAAGVLFLVRHSRSEARADLLLAGLALGICFGTKFYGYTSVVALLAVWAVARLACRVRPAVVARQALAVGGLVLAAGGVWMLRNWIQTGNPLMPVRIDLLGATIFDAPPDPQRPIFGFTLLDYADQPSVFDTLGHQFRIGFGWGLVVLAGGVAAAAGLLLFRHRRGLAERSDRVAATLLAATVVLALVYAATPYTAAGEAGLPNAAVINVRYGIPAAIVAVGLIGWLAGRVSAGWRVALVAAALIGSFDALRVAPVNAPRVAWICFGLGGFAAGAAAWIGEDRFRFRLPRPSPGRLAAAAACVLVLGAIAGEVLQKAFNDDRYTPGDPALDYVIASSADGRSVALAGFWNLDGVVPTYPSFGPRLQNHVNFVGWKEDDALLRRFDSRAPFLGQLARLDPDLLLVGRATPSEFDPDRDRVSPPRAELAWARSAGYREVARSDRFVVLQPPRRAPPEDRLRYH
jgi:hypothetical protein